MGPHAASLNKKEFLDKFYTGLGAKQRDMDKNEQKRARLLRMGPVDSPDSFLRVKTQDFRDQHKRLFTRESHKKLGKRTDDTNCTLFEKFREDYSNPFEAAKESNAIVKEIKLINFSMFVLG
jgi:hypothetical protein